MQRQQAAVGHWAEGHTGRTSAYGGRDYEYSSNIASRKVSSSQESRVASGTFSRHQASSSRQQGSSSALISQHASSSAQVGNQSSSSAMIGQQGSRTAMVGQQASRSAMIGQQASSSAMTGQHASQYQTTAQQSFRGAQTSEQRSGRRKTWAESSILHGAGGSGIGQSLYAADYHQHSCPASKVYTQDSPFKYERQSSSGHKMFRQDMNNTR